MKKVILLIVAMLALLSVKAQDIILKIDGGEIKANVVEITDQVIKYKEFDYPNGPIRNIYKVDVFSITYQDGHKEVIFNKNNYQNPSDSEPVNNSNVLSQPTIDDLEMEFDRIGNNDEQMLEFFRDNGFTRYYQNFSNACEQRNKGKRLLNAGLILQAVAITGYITCLFAYGEGYIVAAYLLSSSLAITGEVLTVVSIPVSAVAGARKRYIKDDFERSYFGLYQPSLSFGLTQNGVGLTFNF